MSPIIVSLVERGWQAARECSLEVQGDGIHVVHLIKGRVEPAVRALSPSRPGIRLVSLARSLFWPLAYLATIGWLASGRLCAVLVDNERSQRRLRTWCHLARTPVWLARQGSEGYELWAGADRLGRAPWRACELR